MTKTIGALIKRIYKFGKKTGKKIKSLQSHLKFLQRIFNVTPGEGPQKMTICFRN